MKPLRVQINLKQFVVGRGSETTFVDAFEMQEAIIQYLGDVDTTCEGGALLNVIDNLVLIGEYENNLEKFGHTLKK
ncbi:Unknown protein [Striga hermonthica]|uniref:Uncharacterized protein n=1 Tax=Striga hermonthica TaxID=68872 RepID=A0A9N7MP56_STRHE|nr:Unknown protein [Striga hermonthica]